MLGTPIAALPQISTIPLFFAGVWVVVKSDSFKKRKIHGIGLLVASEEKKMIK